MAQRTAFLNSDAKGYNKDFHHTWIHNYLLEQVGVMFSNYNTKPEFLLGDGQISGGKAIIRCTRTTGAFAGQKILVLFESTATENINTNGDKKVFIEIPEIYINDSTAITDTLTQGLNLGVGVIKSESDYPTHTNYIPLWEITGGDWAGAVDKRPEILAKGKPNSISYFDNNGVQRSMVLDSASLNKFLKSNGAGVAPSWADVGDVVEVSNLKNTFFAGEDILPKSMFRMESELDTIDAIDESIRIGYDTDTAKVQLNTILNGEEGDKIKLNLQSENAPADDLNIRIETVDSNGNATGTLIDPSAIATVNPTATLEEISIDLDGMISGTTAGQEVAVVLSRSGALSVSNYYKVGVASADTGIWKVKTFDGTNWNLETGKKGYISSDLFMEEGAMQSKATTEFLSQTTGYCEAGATAGNEFTGVRFGMVEHNGFKPGDKVFLTDTGELSNISGAIQKQVGLGVRTDIVEIGSTGIGLGGGVMTYDAVVAADGSGDYESIEDALADDKFRLFIKKGSYDIIGNQYGELIIKADSDIVLQGENTEDVKINIHVTQRNGDQSFIGLNKKTGYSGEANGYIANLTINCHYTGNMAYQVGIANAGVDFVKISSCKLVATTENGLNFYPTRGPRVFMELCKASCTDQNASTGINLGLILGSEVTYIRSSFSLFATNKTLSHLLDMRSGGTTIDCFLTLTSYNLAETGTQLASQSISLGSNYEIKSGKGKLRIYGTLYNCTFTNSTAAEEDTVKYNQLKNGVEQWNPGKSYTIGTYVIDPALRGYLKCKSSHESSGTNPDETKWDKVEPTVDISGSLFGGGIYIGDNHDILMTGTTIYLPSMYSWAASGADINSTYINTGKKCTFTVGGGFNTIKDIKLSLQEGNYIINLSGDFNKISGTLSYLRTDARSNKSEGTASKINVKGNYNIVKDNMFLGKDYVPVLTNVGYTGNIVSDNILKKDIYGYND